MISTLSNIAGVGAGCTAQRFGFGNLAVQPLATTTSTLAVVSVQQNGEDLYPT